MRTPRTTLALLFTISLGIGSTVSVQAFVKGLTKPSTPLPSADRVVSIFGRDAHLEAGPLSYPEYLSVRGHPDAFEWAGAARVRQGALELDSQSATVRIAAVTSDLAGLFGLPMDKGIVISHRIWMGEFGAKAELGQIQIDGIGGRVGGVAPEWLEGIYSDRPIDVWMLLPEGAQQVPDPNSRNLWVLGRLARNVSPSEAQIRLRMSPGLGDLQVLLYTGMTPQAAEGISRVGGLLEFGAGGVFLIACVNVVLFLLGRAFHRSHETALRVALGASRRQLARELLSDSVVICMAGGILGMLFALWTSRVLPTLLFEQDAERLIFAPDRFSIFLVSALGATVTILCGLVPILVIAHDRPVTVLRRTSSGPSPGMRRLRLSLVVLQMASCCLLVISTAFLRDDLRAALATSASHGLDHSLFATVQAHPEVGIRYFEQVEQATKAVAVAPIAWAARLPGSQPAWQSFRFEPARVPLREVTLDVAWFNARSLTLFALPPVAGRLFGFAERTCRAAIVNEKAAAELFDRYTAGRTLHDAANLPVEIIGVVAMRKPAHGLQGNRPTIYYDYTNRREPPPDGVTGTRFRAPVVSELGRGELDVNVVSPAYFDAMGIKRIEGDTAGDHKTSGACRVGMVNQEAADLYFGGKAVGGAVIDDSGRRTEIVGVVHSSPLGTFQRRVEPTLYLPMSQDTLPRMTMILRAREMNEAVLADVRRRIDAVPGRGPAPLVVKTLDTHLTQTSLAPLHIATIIFGASATTTLLLSVLGLFGALSDAARQRRRELAVRVALGAQRWRVIRQVLGEGGRIACAGTLAGMLGSLLLSRWIAGITGTGRSPALWIWLTAPLVSAGAVALASLFPARRASMVNPLMAMRHDD